ncbi:hypothetical protein FJN13_18400 [Alteromonas mediterranea]|uniref:DUF6702 family protein n=1 Tax=Alteromonas mediterranea TaxID=314275 RepID=UPI001131D266|nr:DUF6702 family protein [Alteromonas mediterranea]QDG36666.1 hypothetical protein FJN13_18400 [Alteromonas mediterranea]QGX63678.1 hypothetical protein FJN15_18690 [Alteromonas mediterranea]
MTSKLSLPRLQQSPRALLASVCMFMLTATVLVGAASYSTALQAHQIKAAITTVLFNPRTENIEVMHRFNLHDAEHAVKALFDKHADIMDDVETQQHFADYVARHFAILNAAGEPLTLADVGFEVEGKHFWVYQETAEPPVLEGVKIRHDALRDLWPKQVNTLNVEGKGDIKTLTFADSVNLLEVSFNSQNSDHH